LEDVSSEEQSSQLIGKAVFLPENMLPTLNSEQFYYHEIIGYKAIDSAFSEEMIVLDIIDRPLQPLIRLKNIKTEKTSLIPLVDHFIKNIDKKSRIIELCAHPDLYKI
jgi:16S rRNA processing protein RimM